MFEFMLNEGTGMSLIEFGATWWLQSFLLTAMGLIAGMIASRSGPAPQSTIYRATLLSVVICPAFTILMTSIGIPLVSIDLSSRSTAPGVIVVANDETVGTESNVGAPTTARLPNVGDRSPSASPGATKTPSPIDGDPAYKDPSIPQAVSTGHVASTSKPDASRDPGTLSDADFASRWMPLAFVCWLVGFLVLSLRLARDWFSSRRMDVNAGNADELATRCCQETATQLGVRTPQVRVSPFLSSPCLVGHWRPTVYLSEETPESSYREVFLHELAHLGRSDWLWCVVGRGVRAVLWMQPLMWILARKSAIAAEEVCDDYVLKYGGNREGYVRRLVEIAESRLPAASIGVAMVSMRPTLARRARRILDSTRELSTTVGYRFVSLSLLAMLVSATAVGLLYVDSPQAKAQTTGDEPARVPSPVQTTTNKHQKGGADQKDADNPRNIDSAIELSSEIRGRVVDPEGNAVAGAQLILERNQDRILPTGYKHTIDVIDRAKSAADGTFTLDPGPHGRIGQTQIVATADGFGLAVDLSFRQADSPTIRLVRDVPVDGRVLSTDGQPLAGISISVLQVVPATSESDVANWIKNRRPELFQNNAARDSFGDHPAYKTVFPGRGTVHQDCGAMPVRTVVTGEDGRFRLSGFGRNRKLLLRLDGPSIVNDHVLVVTRQMEPFKAYEHNQSRVGLLNFTHHGANCNIVARPAQAIVGRIVDAETEQPLAGETVAISRYAEMRYSSNRGFAWTQTDNNGTFRLDGLPVGGGHEIRFLAKDDSAYFATDLDIPKTSEPGPIECEMRLTQAKWIRGRITNQDGQGVKAIVQYYPYRSNRSAEKYPNYDPIIVGSAPNSRLQSDQDGYFRIRAIPGRGVIGARVESRGDAVDYLSDVPDDLIERMGGKRMGKLFHPWTYTWYHVMRDVELPAGSDEIEVDLTVRKGGIHTIAVKDADGNPVSGVDTLGRVFPPQVEKPGSSTIDVIGLSPDDKRLIVFIDRERKLGKSLWITPENRPREIQLEACGRFSGRAVDGDGNPVGGLRVRVTPFQDQDSWSRVLTEVETNEDGTFSVLLPPGNSYRVWHYSELGPNFGIRINPTSGATYDIGDVSDGDNLTEEETTERLTHQR